MGSDSATAGSGYNRADESTVGGAQAGPKAAGARRNAAPEGDPCADCGAPISAIRIDVDGRTLLMESCDGCDTRRWQLAGERIDLQEALHQVGEHAGRRRADA